MICLDQVERFYAVEKFVKGEKDVLCATDVASKGLDFPDIQHVINYDLPEDIENYGKHQLLFKALENVPCLVPFKYIALVEQAVVADVVSPRRSSTRLVVTICDRSFLPCPSPFLDEAILLDLKHLLIEAKQTVPPFLLQVDSDKERLLDIGG